MRTLAGLVLAGLVGAIAVNIVARILGLPVVGANLVAIWLLPLIAMVAFAPAGVGTGWRSIGVAALFGFAAGEIGSGLLAAGFAVGGVEPVLGVPRGLRFLAAAGALLCALALFAVRVRQSQLLACAVGVGAALLPGWQLSEEAQLLAGLGAFALAIFVRAPVAYGLIAGAALAPGPLSEAAIAQAMVRGLSGHVLLAVPLFLAAAALMLVAGYGERIAAAARAISGKGRRAAGYANIGASALFGGLSASSLADAAMGGRLLAPAMVDAGYPSSRAAALTAAAAILPNVMPPSIALLLAASATDLSVASLWLSGAGAAVVLAAGLVVAVRLVPPPGVAATKDLVRSDPIPRPAHAE
ncbi:MAG: TRAP transporter large permease subunit, partial [Pseudomonadota bacterium]